MMRIQQASRSSLRDFKVIGRLGSGSFGTVFKVQRLADSQFYVLKQITMGGMDAQQQREAIKEVQIMADLDHEYCVRYYDSFIDEGKLNIVMEYCDRGDLQRLLKNQGNKKLKEDVIWRLFIQMALGLRYLHTKRILHRDIKSANVFLCKGNRLKIGDLGVARVLGTNTHFAQTCVGTPYYLSPELCTGNPYNAKSDVWALGCVLYEMCTLKHPFDASNQGALILKIVSGKYPKVTGEYSKPLRKLVTKMLTRDSKARPSIAQVLMSRTLVQKAEALGIVLPADILEGAALHDERIVLAAQQRAAQRAAQARAADSKAQEATRRVTRRPSQGGITGTGLLPRTTSTSSHASHGSHHHGSPASNSGLLKGNVRGGRVRRGAPQRRPKVMALPAEHRTPTTARRGHPSRAPARATSSPAVRRGANGHARPGSAQRKAHSASPHVHHHRASAAAAAAEVADLPPVVAAAPVRIARRNGGPRRTVQQLQMAASGGRVGGGGGDDVGAGAALANMHIDDRRGGAADDVDGAMRRQFEEDLHRPATRERRNSRGVVVQDKDGLRESFIDAPPEFWDPVVPDDAVLDDVVRASARDAARDGAGGVAAGSGAGSGRSRAHEVGIDVLEVSHGIEDEEDEEEEEDDGDLDPATFGVGTADDDFEEGAEFLHPGALFSVSADQHSRLADHHVGGAGRGMTTVQSGGSAESALSESKDDRLRRESHSESKHGRDEAASSDGGKTAEPAAAPARPAPASGSRGAAGGSLYDAPDRIAELMDTQSQLKAQIAHLRDKCASSVDQAVIDRVCNATSRLVVEEDPEVQAALHGADPLDIYSLIKLLFCVNSLRETEAQMETLMTSMY